MDDIDQILSEQTTKVSNAGRWKGGRYDTEKPEELESWDALKAMLRYNGDNNIEVKGRIDNLAKAINSGVLEIRKVKKG